MEMFILWTAILIFQRYANGNLGKRQASNSTSTRSIFHHRAYHSSIVLGDYLYIEGGELSTWNEIGSGNLGDEDVEANGNIVNYPNNYTYSIDLSTSWTNSTVVLNRINKGSDAPILNSGTLWLDASGESFYMYAGAVSFISLGEGALPYGNALYEFTPSGDSGRWSTVYFDQDSTFNDLDSTTQGLYAYGNGLGFSLGGLEDVVTDAAIIEPYQVSGMVVFDTSSKEWNNLSTEAISYTGTAINGAMAFVPSFGAEGLLLILSGSPSSPPTFYGLGDIAIFDIQSQQWSTQKTSGDVPPSRESGCAVGVEGDGTYEIFFYGGYVSGDLAGTVGMDVLYVLSLPSFVWHRQDYRPRYGRYKHTCELVGNRQMVVVGGVVVDPKYASPSVDTWDNIAEDPWPNGFAIFDLSAMEWKDEYDSSASEYTTPEVVKTYLANNGPYPSAWSNPTVKSWFIEKRAGEASSQGGPNDQDSHSTNVGAIAGGVVGGVVGLALIIGLILYLRRRKGTRPSRENVEEVQEKRIHVDAELEGTIRPRQEVSGQEKLAEVDPQTRYELDSSWQGHEVNGSMRHKGT